MARNLSEAMALDAPPPFVTHGEMDQKFERLERLILAMVKPPATHMATTITKEHIQEMNATMTSTLTSTIEGVNLTIEGICREVNKIKQSNSVWMDDQMEHIKELLEANKASVNKFVQEGLGTIKKEIADNVANLTAETLQEAQSQLNGILANTVEYQEEIKENDAK